MRLDADEVQKIHGRYVNPGDIKLSDVFIDPWGIVWRAVEGAPPHEPAPGHQAISAIQLTVDEDNKIVDSGVKVACEVPTSRDCKVLSQDWRTQLEKLFYFDPNA